MGNHPKVMFISQSGKKTDRGFLSTKEGQV